VSDSRFVCRPQDLKRAKYELQYSQRSHYGADDAAFGCMGIREDDQGKQGVYLKKDVVTVAEKALSQHVKKVAPHILPLRELVCPQLFLSPRCDSLYLSSVHIISPMWLELCTHFLFFGGLHCAKFYGSTRG